MSDFIDKIIITSYYSESETAEDRIFSILSNFSFEAKMSKYLGHFESTQLKPPGKTAQQNHLSK